MLRRSDLLLQEAAGRVNARLRPLILRRAAIPHLSAEGPIVLYLNEAGFFAQVL